MLSEFFKDERVVKVDVSSYASDNGSFTALVQGDIGAEFNIPTENGKKMNFFYSRGNTIEEVLSKALEKLKQV